MLTPGPTETAPTAHVAGVPPKLARIGAGLILLLGALTAMWPGADTRAVRSRYAARIARELKPERVSA